MNNYCKSIRELVAGKQPSEDISELLYTHDCYYLLSKLEKQNSYPSKLQLQTVLNKISVNERFRTTAEVFRKFEENNIPYAVIKGAVLSESAYGNLYYRNSGDIDMLIDRKDIDAVKHLMYECGFIQGRVSQDGITPYSRQELLFQTTMTHQTAPFVKETNNRLCPYVNVDINFDLFWGESNESADMGWVLQHTYNTTVCDVTLRKLDAEMEFVSLCLHHYKDMNSIYLLYSGSMKLRLFCDIYYFLKNCKMNWDILLKYCNHLHVQKYIYYCLHYTNIIFGDKEIEKYLSLLYSPENNELINTFGLDDKERQPWNVDFFERLFEIDMPKYFETTLPETALNKIKTNLMFM